MINNKISAIIFFIFYHPAKIIPQKETNRNLRKGCGWVLNTNPNFDTNAPPFEPRGCKVILGGVFLVQGVQIMDKCTNLLLDD